MGTWNLNHNLKKERFTSSFLVKELTNVLDGDKNLTDRRKYLETVIFDNEDFNGFDIRHMNGDEKIRELLRRHIGAIKKCRQIVTKSDLKNVQRIAVNFITGLTIHEVTFVPMLKLKSSDEQLQEWLPLVESFEMIGCYARMELRHGSNLNKFETFAVYDPKSEEFVLNTPTLSSTKWWVDGVARTANYCLVDGHLYSGGKHLGIQSFLVKIRDHSHHILPGITIGDVGVKMGLEGADTGFLRLTDVRIARTHMLMRSLKILKDGSFANNEDRKVFNRETLEEMMKVCQDTVHTLCMSVTISVRYSCVRHQSTLATDQRELQVLEYQTQQDKLFPIMCSAFAYKLILPTFEDWIKNVSSSSLNKDSLEQLEIFAFVSGLKLLITTESPKNVELCRTACGGHGFSAASNLPTSYKEIVANVVNESEPIFHPEVARFLLENLIMTKSGSNNEGFFKYLERHDSKFSGSLSMDSLLEAFGASSLRTLKQCRKKLEKFSEKKLPSNSEDFSPDLARAALAHVKYVVASTLVEKVRHLKGSNAVRRVLERICRLHMISGLLKSPGNLLRDGYFTRSDLDDLEEECYRMYEVMRPDAISLVDAFDFHDKQLNSALGSYAGNVYEELYAYAQKSQLNEIEVHPSFFTYLKPIRHLDGAML